jgi:type 1 glutamine amidotransferase
VADPWPNTKRLLFVADVQSGYHHDAINHTMGVVEELGRKTGSFITFLRTDSQLITRKPIAPQGKYAPSQNINTKTLDYFDAVFLLPAGNGTMNDEQKNALLSFVRDDGKGLIVGHAAGTAFLDKGGVLAWPEWPNLIGAQMKGEFHATCRVIVEDPAFPGAMSWGKTSFMFEEQHANFGGPYSREIDHVILRLDPETVPEQYRAQHPDGDFPVAFTRQYGKGRVFNIGWGEFEATWDDPGMQKFMLGAIQWALGSVPADTKPGPLSKPAAWRVSPKDIWHV